MKYPKFTLLSVVLIIACGLIFYANNKINNNSNYQNSQNSQATAENKEQIIEEFGNLPLYFEPNEGQLDESVKFLARGHGYALFLNGKEAVLSLRKGEKDKAKKSVIKMTVEGANDSPKSKGLDAGGGKSNYIIGSDPKNWRTNVPNFKKVEFEKVYEGVDLVYYGNGRQLEYDFVVSPNADPNQIKLKFDGVENAEIEKQTGDLLLKTEAGTIRQHKPISFQNINGTRKDVFSQYVVEKSKDKGYEIKFLLGEYDKSKELIIDPILAYGSYLGGNSTDIGNAVTFDASGNAYVTGTTISVNFPTTEGAIKRQLLPIASSVYGFEAFVTKVNPTGTSLVYSTYFGGNGGSDSGNGIVVDANGNAFIAGGTDSPDFPVVNAGQATRGGGSDAYLAKINPTGTAIVFSTFLGGSSFDEGVKLVKNANDEIFIGGVSNSSNFPTTAGVLKPASCQGSSCTQTGSEAFVAKFDANGTKLWATLFGGISSAEFVNDIAIDANGNSYIVGQVSAGDFPATPGAFQTTFGGGVDGFIAKINPIATQTVYASYLGGGLQSDRAYGVSVDANENAYVAGQTENIAFPTTAGAFDTTHNGGADAFITKFNSSGTGLVFSTFLGGQGADKAFTIGLGQNNTIFVGGECSSNTFPLRNSLQGTLGSAFVTQLNADGNALVYSTIVGVGSVKDLAVDSTDNVYVTGEGHNFPVTPNAPQPTISGGNTSSIDDGFILKLGAVDENQTFYSISGTVNGNNTGGTSPIIVTISGTVNRSYTIPYGGGNGGQYFFGNLPASGNYTVTARKVGYATSPESAIFNNLQANQSADFTILANQQPEGVITSPQHQTVYNIPANITIQATASDPDGHAITKVDFVAYSSTTGSVPLATDTTAPYEFTWENVPTGTWALHAIPTDELGLQGFSTPTVHVFVIDGGNPSVTISSPTDGQTFTEGDNVPLGAVVSSSVTLVEFYDQNNTLIGRRAGSPWTTVWRVMNPGNYTITAKAFNAQGQFGTSPPVNIVVNPINHRISGRIVDSITNAGVSNVALSLTSPTNPNITANTTTDESGNYLFTNLGTTPNDGVVITPSLTNHTFTPQNRTIGFLGFINWANQNFAAIRQTQITVNMTSPTNGEVFDAPATINLAANASSGAGTITRVEFYRQFGSNTLLGTDTTAPFEFQLTDVTAGSYTYFARAFDSTGVGTDSATVSVTVNQPPTTVRIVGEITNPGGGWMPGITVRLTGTANGNPINQTSTTNFFGVYGFFNLPRGGTYTVTPQPSGTLTFTPESQTFENMQFENVDVDFIASAVNQPPTVNITSPTDGAVFTMPASIPVAANAADADGTVTHLSLSASNGSFTQAIGQSNNGTFNANWQPNQPGNYTIFATARDNANIQTTTQISITVNPPAPVSVSGRVVDRNSQGISDVTVELRDSPTEQTLIAAATTDASGNYTLPNIPTFSSYVLRASKQDYTFSPQKRTYFNLSTNQTTGDFTGTLQIQPSDFDGDSTSDIAVWRPSNGVWHLNRSDAGYTSMQFGGASFGDVAVPGNYDGDRKIDVAVYRSGIWYINQSSNGQVAVRQLGLAGDKPVSGDYDGDGKTDIAVWRPSNGVWYIWRSSDGGFDIRQFGLSGDIPLVGDYDGDGKADLTVWRPSTGIWYVLQSTDGNFRVYQLGLNGDIPLVGDFDGDKLADYTIFRPSTGVWYVYRSSDGGFSILQWGNSTDIPVPADYDRDGKTDFGVFRASEGNWYIYKSSDNSYIIQNFGLNGDVPIPAAYNQ